MMDEQSGSLVPFLLDCWGRIVKQGVMHQVALPIIHQTGPLAGPERTALLRDIKTHRHLSVDLSANVPVLVSDDELGINLKTA